MHAALGQHAASVRGVLESAVSWSTLFSARPLLHTNVVQVTPASTSQLLTRPAIQASANISGAAGLLLRAHADRLHPFRCTHIPSPASAQSILAPWKTQTRAFHASFAPAALRRPVLPQRNTARQISLASVKKWWGSESPVPGPLQLWRLEKLEEQADLAPNDPAAQRTLYAFYIEMNLKNAYESLIRRWERTIEFSPQSPVIRDDEIFRLYVLALVKTSQSASVDSAVRRRESVLAKAPDAVPLVAGDKSRSQMIAQSVVEDPKAHTLLNMPTPPPAANATPDSTGPSSATAAATSTVLPGSSTPPGVAALLAAGGPGGKDSPIYVTIAQPKGQGMWNFLRFLVIVGACGFLVFTSFAVFAENTGILKNKAEPSEYQVTDGKSVTFADVHGVDEAKDELQEIVQFLKDPSSFSTLGGRLSKGVLLTGPPGTGKTLLARAVAGEAGVSFFFASGSEFDEMFVGVGAKRVRQLFKSAREKAPAIIFIDELDAIGTKRSARDQQHMKQTLNQLLVEMDGFNPSEGIIVIGATNFPQTLDGALVRPGRFDKKITVPLPDVRGREQILKHHLRNTKVASGVDVNILARGTPGFSGADLENLCNQAAVRAAREKSLAVALKHLEWARDRIIMGAERRSFFMDDKVKLMTAYHEGGHALVAMFTEGATPVYKVTCMPRGQSLGHTSFLPTQDRVSVSLKEYRAQLDVAMGGRLAEEIVYGPEEVTSGCSSDLQQATNTARAMVRYFGMSDEVGPVFYHPQDASISAHERQVVDAEVKRLLSAAHERARTLLTEKREELRLLAEALIEHETLDLEEVKKVIRGEKIRQGEKHAVSNVEITTITSPPLPIPAPPEANSPPVISSPPSSRQSGQTEPEDPPFISA